jgi:putative transposase
MKRSRLSEKQIIGILKEHEAGVSVADLCRKHGVSDASISKWKAKFGGMEVSEAKRPKTLEDENTRLKRLNPAQNLDPHPLMTLKLDLRSHTSRDVPRKQDGPRRTSTMIPPLVNA